ncbi:MAG: hypothetical protein QGH93_06300, partial [Gammaproteobacteria bacterium]|nr:hypothetical protein [Gammaproteobacteria bacterium]
MITRINNLPGQKKIKTNATMAESADLHELYESAVMSEPSGRPRWMSSVLLILVTGSFRHVLKCYVISKPS